MLKILPLAQLLLLLPPAFAAAAIATAAAVVCEREQRTNATVFSCKAA